VIYRSKIRLGEVVSEGDLTEGGFDLMNWRENNRRDAEAQGSYQLVAAVISGSEL
jgi:hypothetical protein